MKDQDQLSNTFEEATKIHCATLSTISWYCDIPIHSMYSVIPDALKVSIGVNEAEFISNLAYHLHGLIKNPKMVKVTDRDSWFYCNKDDIKNRTGLSLNNQCRIIKTLSKSKLIEVKRRGMPSRNYYRINWSKLEKIINIYEQR